MKLNVNQKEILRKIDDKELRKAFKKQWKHERKLDAKRDELMVRIGIKPPLGLIPKFVRDEERISEIEEAIDRFEKVGQEIPSEWIEEKYQLKKSIKTEKKTAYIVNWDLLGTPDFAKKINLAEFEKINGKGIPWFQKTAEEVNEKWDKAMAESQFKPENCLNKPYIPKEFCVKITEENIEILKTTCNSDRIKNLDYFSMGCFITKRSNTTELLCNTKHIVEKKLIPIVSTEEFLRYIGKDGLDTEINWKKTPNTYNSEKINIGLMDEIGQYPQYFPKSNQTLSEIANEVCVKGLEFFNKIQEKKKEKRKPLEFDLPMKEDVVYLSVDEIINHIDFPENYINKNTLKAYLELIACEKKLKQNKKSPN